MTGVDYLVLFSFSLAAVFVSLALFSRADNKADDKNLLRLRELKLELDYLRNTVADFSTFSKAQEEINHRIKGEISESSKDIDSLHEHIAKYQLDLFNLKDKIMPKQIEFVLAPLKGAIPIEITSKPPPVPAPKSRRRK